jgi:hypothetical protein
LGSLSLLSHIFAHGWYLFAFFFSGILSFMHPLNLDLQMLINCCYYWTNETPITICPKVKTPKTIIVPKIKTYSGFWSSLYILGRMINIFFDTNGKTHYRKNWYTTNSGWHPTLGPKTLTITAKYYNKSMIGSTT